MSVLLGNYPLALNLGHCPILGLAACSTFRKISAGKMAKTKVQEQFIS
jgi:hypothetical protein